MIRDPFFLQIKERLAGILDPESFERCAVDLLRTAYPTLVPISGGSDAGMDGAIGDAEGETYPLVSTTSEDVIGNLTNNLKSYIDNGRKRRKVVLATSRNLTPKRMLNLFNRAEQLGFTLINVYDQTAMTYLLYRNTMICTRYANLDVSVEARGNDKSVI